MSRTTSLALYIAAFLIGGVLMGFEMLGSRYLFPYFGSGIGTWAGLISTVLIALTVGYFVGGQIVDRIPSPRFIALTVALSALYLSLLPATADHALIGILNSCGDGLLGILAASCGLLLIPLSLLGTLSPVCVRLLTRTTTESGRVSGLVYGISTIGNVFGTLFTTFALIPTFGSRKITYLFAAVLAVCSLILFFTPEPVRQSADA